MDAGRMHLAAIHCWSPRGHLVESTYHEYRWTYEAVLRDRHVVYLLRRWQHSRREHFVRKRGTAVLLRDHRNPDMRCRSNHYFALSSTIYVVGESTARQNYWSWRKNRRRSKRSGKEGGL